MKKYKLVIFDFDGTLADSFSFFVSAVNDLADIYNFRKVDEVNIHTLRRYDAKRILDYLGVPLWKVPIVAKSFTAKMAERVSQISLFAGVDNMLHSLSVNGIVLSLITSNSYDNVCHVLHSKNMDLMVHPQCGTSLFGKSSKLRNILRKTGIDPRDTIFIGDEIRDLEAANSEGIDFGAVSWGYTDVDALLECSPTETFSCVEEITVKLVQQHTS